MTEPRRIDSPRVLYTMIRMVRGGIEVPACIRLEPDHHGNKVLIAYIRGIVADIESVWLRRGREITEAEYDYQIELCKWADQHDPRGPIANPMRRVDFNRMASIY